MNCRVSMDQNFALAGKTHIINDLQELHQRVRNHKKHKTND